MKYAALILLLIALISGCSQGGTDTEFYLNTNNLQLYFNRFPLLHTDLPESYTITDMDVSGSNLIFQSQNPSIAVVNQNGTVTALSEGTAMISVSDQSGSITENCFINVTGIPFTYKQCDDLWRDDEMGTGGGTICSVGCVLCSMVMMMTLEIPEIDPAVMNTFCNENSLYASGSSTIMYNAPENYPGCSFQYMGGESFSYAVLKSELDMGNPALLNVKSGSHWVLVVGYTGSGTDYGDFLYLDSGYGGMDGIPLTADDDPGTIRYYHRP